MSDIFNAIKDFFVLVVDVLNFIFQGLTYCFSLLVDGVRFIGEIISEFPTPFIAGGLALVVVCVLYKVLGRENQS